jgi:hypothetical protein
LPALKAVAKAMFENGKTYNDLRLKIEGFYENTFPDRAVKTFSTPKTGRETLRKIFKDVSIGQKQVPFREYIRSHAAEILAYVQEKIDDGTPMTMGNLTRDVLEKFHILPTASVRSLQYEIDILRTFLRENGGLDQNFPSKDISKDFGWILNKRFIEVEPVLRGSYQSEIEKGNKTPLPALVKAVQDFAQKTFEEEDQDALKFRTPKAGRDYITKKLGLLNLPLPRAHKESKMTPFLRTINPKNKRTYVKKNDDYVQAFILKHASHLDPAYRKGPKEFKGLVEEFEKYVSIKIPGCRFANFKSGRNLLRRYYQAYIEKRPDGFYRLKQK